MRVQTDDTLLSLSDVGAEVLYLIGKTVRGRDLDRSRQVLRYEKKTPTSPYQPSKLFHLVADRPLYARCNVSTHEDDPLLVPPITKHALCPSQPGLFYSLTDLDGECGFGLGKGLGRVFESEVGTVLQGKHGVR